MLTWTFLPVDFEVGRHTDLISARQSHILCGSASRPVFTVCILPEGIVIPYLVNKCHVLCLGLALETVCSYISLSAHCEMPHSLWFVTHLPVTSYVLTCGLIYKTVQKIHCESLRTKIFNNRPTIKIKKQHQDSNKKTSRVCCIRLYNKKNYYYINVWNGGSPRTTSLQNKHPFCFLEHVQSALALR